MTNGLYQLQHAQALTALLSALTAAPCMSSCNANTQHNICCSFLCASCVYLPCPPAPGTVVRMMDFLLPTSALAWGYWFMMLQHFATMFNAYMPDVLFAGAVSPISRLMKQSWSAGFLAAAFASDALKTAADRQHLQLPENRQLNLCLALLEAGYAVCLATGMAQGTVVVRPYSYLRLATAMASVCFCMGVWWMSVKEAQSKGWPQQPSISSYDWQEQMEKRPDYAKVTSMAVVTLNIITCAIG
eukprot:GHUV01025208.1.p1 GENE.GHUV01025208.1~~GHUV01025208.1.p1  ORF type:complete len:244 (+),score=65.96 GHUV01025208.1:195-926(+)